MCSPGYKPKHDQWDCHRAAAPNRPPWSTTPHLIGQYDSPMAQVVSGCLGTKVTQTSAALDVIGWLGHENTRDTKHDTLLMVLISFMIGNIATTLEHGVCYTAN